MAIDLEQFLQGFQELSSQSEVVIPNFDATKPEDRDLALRMSLRGKKVDEYFAIVDRLFIEHDNAKSKTEKERLHNLTSAIMGIGSDVLGIDWS